MPEVKEKAAFSERLTPRSPRPTKQSGFGVRERASYQDIAFSPQSPAFKKKDDGKDLEDDSEIDPLSGRSYESESVSIKDVSLPSFPGSKGIDSQHKFKPVLDLKRIPKRESIVSQDSVFEVKSSQFEVLDGEAEEIKHGMEEDMDRMSRNCVRFQNQFQREIDQSRKILEEQLVKAFIDIAKFKLPDVYLRSLPKFGGNELSNALYETLIAMKRDKQNVLKVKFNQDIIDEIGKVVEDNIFEVFSDPMTIMNNLVDSIDEQTKRIQTKTKDLDLLLHSYHGKNEELSQEVEHYKNLLQEKTEHADQLTKELMEKDVQMDIIREQIKRRNDQLARQRESYHKELMQVKMLVYAKNELGRTVTPETIPEGEFSLKFQNHTRLSFDDESAVPQEVLEKISEAVENEKTIARNERKGLLQRHQSQLKEKELEIQSLKNQIHRLSVQLKKERKRNLPS